MGGKDYRDLVAWKKAFELTLAIYKETSCFPAEEKFGITSQLRRAGVSVPSNIAEGQGRKNGEFLRYLLIALGSAKEIETQLLLPDALGYFRSKQTSSKLISLTAEVSRLINGLARSLRHRQTTTDY